MPKSRATSHNEYCGIPCTTPGHEHLPPTVLINRAETEDDRPEEVNGAVVQNKGRAVDSVPINSHGRVIR